MISMTSAARDPAYPATDERSLRIDTSQHPTVGHALRGADELIRTGLAVSLSIEDENGHALKEWTATEGWDPCVDEIQTITGPRTF